MRTCPVNGRNTRRQNDVPGSLPGQIKAQTERDTHAEARKHAYLETVKQYGVGKLAAKAASVPYSTVLRWRDCDPTFRRAEEKVAHVGQQNRAKRTATTVREKKQAYLDALEIQHVKEKATQTVHVSPGTLRRWRKEDPAFAQAE